MPTTTTKPDDLIDAPDLVPANRSGRASHDERGNSIWEWQTQPGVFSRDISSEQFARLQASQLQLVDHLPREVKGTGFQFATGSKGRTRTASEEVKRNAFEMFLKRLRLAD